jgi:acyl carrier protein
MEINEFLKSFADQFDDTDASEIVANTEFHELEEWDSLIALAVLNMSEKKYGKKISFDEMKQCVTVEDLYNVIAAK